LKAKGNKGTSTVFGSIYFIILVSTLASILFITLYDYNSSSQTSIKTEEERMQEKIVLCDLDTTNISGTEYITEVSVNNTGSLTCRIRAVYIDEEFLCDPSDKAINPDDTYINPGQLASILLPPGVEYEKTAKIAVATERGIKSVEYEYILKHGGRPPTSGEQPKLAYGPLELNFDRFYYTECETNGTYDPLAWKPGWNITADTDEIVWNITVTNVDHRNITINKYSSLTLVPSEGPAERKPWYLEPPQGSTTQFLESGKNYTIIYIWSTPDKGTPHRMYNAPYSLIKVFLTFFGVFHEPDGSNKTYGQTIPFEAVISEKVPGRDIVMSASPPVILANSTETSLITATITDRYGNPAVNKTVSFSTDLGTLSSLQALSDSTGTASVTLFPSTSWGLATVSVIWGGLSRVITVPINGAPTALFTESTETALIGEVINFNASDSFDPEGNIVIYSWDFGDGKKALGLLSSHAYASEGLYTVTLTVTDNYGATASATATKTILPNGGGG